MNEKAGKERKDRDERRNGKQNKRIGQASSEKKKQEKTKQSIPHSSHRAKDGKPSDDSNERKGTGSASMETKKGTTTTERTIDHVRKTVTVQIDRTSTRPADATMIASVIKPEAREEAGVAVPEDQEKRMRPAARKGNGQKSNLNHQMHRMEGAMLQTVSVMPL